MKLFNFFILSLTYSATAGVLDTEIKLASTDVLKTRLYQRGYSDFADREADDFSHKNGPVISLYSDLLSKIDNYVDDFFILRKIFFPMDPIKMKKEIPEIVFREWPHLLFACRHYTNHPRVWGFEDDEDEFTHSPEFLEKLNSSYMMRANFTGEL